MASTPDLFRQSIDSMIDLRHPLAVLATRMPWPQIEAALAPKFAHADRAGVLALRVDMLGPTLALSGAGRSNAGRPKLALRLMASLVYLKHSFNLSDEELCERWSENVLWQFFSGQQFYEHRKPCDATQIGRFRTALGEDGLEQLLKATIDAAAAMKLVKPEDCERVTVDTTVQEKAIAHPVDSRLLEIARHKVVSKAKRAGITLKQTFAKQAKTLRRQAGGYAHAKQFKRLQRTVKRQRTILGIVMREVQRKLKAPGFVPASAPALAELTTLMERAERIRTQRKNDKKKLYALHAPEVECIGKGKARKPYEFGVKAAVVILHRIGLMVGARSFPGNPFDGHILNPALEQATNLMQDIGGTIKEVVADLGFRGVDADNPGKLIIHRGKFKSLSAHQKVWLRRRQAVEPAIGHLKSDNRMDRCWLKGTMGDALHTISCAAGYNLRWLMRQVASRRIKALFLRALRAMRDAAYGQYGALAGLKDHRLGRWATNHAVAGAT
jgi:transposase, IS5 family